MHRSSPAARVLVALVALSLPASSAAAAECKPSNEIGDGGATLRLRADGCSLSLPDTTAALDALLEEAWSGRRMPIDRASLGLGRIIDYPWLSKALAEAAMKSPVWEPDKGRGRRGSDNSAVGSLVDTRRLLAPLAPLFTRYGVRARAGSVEKVLVGRVGETEALASLVGQKLADGKKLPYDAQLWVRLERLPDNP
jgi:hypothetical protein